MSDGSGEVTAGAKDAKADIIYSLTSTGTVDLTFHIPYNSTTTAVTYTFNFIPE